MQHQYTPGITILLILSSGYVADSPWVLILPESWLEIPGKQNMLIIQKSISLLTGEKHWSEIVLTESRGSGIFMQWYLFKSVSSLFIFCGWEWDFRHEKQLLFSVIFFNTIKLIFFLYVLRSLFLLIVGNLILSSQRSVSSFLLSFEIFNRKVELFSHLAR